MNDKRMELTAEDIKNIFKSTKVYKQIVDDVMTYEQYKRIGNESEFLPKVDIVWKRVIHDSGKSIFYSPKDFLEILSDSIIEKVNGTMEDDYWLLVIGETGSAKSSLCLAFYKKIKEKLNQQLNLSMDLVRLQGEYSARTTKRQFDLLKMDDDKKVDPDVIILDEAHNIFDVFAISASSLTRDLVQKAFEIREWKIIHLLNSQMPNQIIKRILMGKITNVIYTFFELVDQNDPNYQIYKKYMEEITGREVRDKTGKILFAVFYNKEKTRKVLKYMLKTGDVITPRMILERHVPDMITSHMFLFDYTSDLYLKYKRIKKFQQILKDYAQMVGVYRSKFADLPLILLYLLDKYADRERKNEKTNKVEKGITIDKTNRYVIFNSFVMNEVKNDISDLEKRYGKDIYNLSILKVPEAKEIAIDKYLYDIYQKYKDIIREREELIAYLIPEFRSNMIINNHENNKDNNR